MTFNDKVESRLTGESLITAINALSHKMILLYSQIVFNQTGLNWQDWRILRAVVALQSCRAQDICAESGLQKPHVSNGLNRLEEAGHISRVKNPENHRSKLVISTEQGQELVRNSTPVLDKLNAQLQKGEDEASSELILKQLRSFENELDKLAKSSKDSQQS